MPWEHEYIFFGCSPPCFRSYSYMIVFLYSLQKIHVEMQKNAIEGLAASRSLLLVHPMVATLKACVALLQTYDAFWRLNIHLSGEKMKERVLLNHLLAELVPSYITQKERVYVTGYADVIFQLHILKQVDYHCKDNEKFRDRDASSQTLFP